MTPVNSAHLRGHLPFKLKEIKGRWIFNLEFLWKEALRKTWLTKPRGLGIFSFFSALSNRKATGHG